MQVKKSLGSLLASTRQFMTVDTSYTATKDSDSKVCTLMAVDGDNNLFVLDMWSAQCQQQKLVNAILQMADRWRCPTVHIEAIKEGISVYDDLMSIVTTKSADMAEVDFLPRIRKFNPGMTAKTAKIASLLRRFDYGRIKMPMRERYQKHGGPFSIRLSSSTPRPVMVVCSTTTNSIPYLCRCTSSEGAP